MRLYDHTHRNLEATVGRSTCWELGAPHEWVIRRMIIRQTGGPLMNFTVRIFNSVRACDGLGLSMSSGGADPDGDYSPDPSAYEVMPPMDGVAGVEAVYVSEAGYMCLNNDGTNSSPVQRIYVQIDIPSQAGASDDDNTTWDVTLGGYTDVG